MEKVLLIGVDGADYNIIKELFSKNELSNFASIAQKGGFSKLISTIPPSSPVAWTSIFTGVPPWRHGILGFLKQKEGEYFYRPVTSRDRKVKAIWNLLSEKNKKSILLNVPFSYPPEKINGIMITGLGSPGKSSDFVYPHSLKKFIFERFPDFDIDFNEGKLERGADIYQMEDEIIKLEEIQANLFIDLLKDNEWDFGAIVLRSLDVIQHFAFDNRKFVERHYKRIDSLIGKIVSEVKKIENKIKIVVCSDHGFRNTKRRFYVNTWLKSQGYLKLKSSDNFLLKIGIDAEKIRDIFWKIGLKGLLGKIERSNFVKYLLKIFPSSSHQYLFDADWERTKAFFYRGSNGLIKINVKGREPRGCVDKTEILRLAAELKSNLRQVVDHANGVKVFRNVLLKEELGIKSYDYPEVILIPNDDYELMDYNVKGNLFEDISNRPGDHGLYGVFISNFKLETSVECVWDVGKLIKRILHL